MYVTLVTSELGPGTNLVAQILLIITHILPQLSVLNVSWFFGFHVALNVMTFWWMVQP